MTDYLKLFASALEVDAHTGGEALKVLALLPTSISEREAIFQYLSLSGISYIATNSTTLFDNTSRVRCVSGPGALTQFLRLHLRESAKKYMFSHHLKMVGVYLTSVFSPSRVAPDIIKITPELVDATLVTIEEKYQAVTSLLERGRDIRVLLVSGSEHKNSSSLLLPDKELKSTGTFTLAEHSPSSMAALEKTILTTLVAFLLDAYHNTASPTDWDQMVSTIPVTTHREANPNPVIDILQYPLCFIGPSTRHKEYTSQLKAMSTRIATNLMEEASPSTRIVLSNLVAMS